MPLWSDNNSLETFKIGLHTDGVVLILHSLVDDENPPNFLADGDGNDLIDGVP